MNQCTDVNCNTQLPFHSRFCFKCGSIANNHVIINNGRPILKRQTHFKCNNCNNILQDYGDNYCRDCGTNVQNIN